MKPPPPDSKGKGLSSPAALALAAAVMVVPANLLPVLSTRTSGEVRTDTIFSGIVGLWKDGMWGIAAIVFTASIIIPILKLAGLSWLLWSARSGAVRHPRRLTRVYAALDFIGRWSMLDVFIVAFLAGLVQFGALANVEARSGIIAFAAVVVFTVLAVEAFDPRLLWRDPSSAEFPRGEARAEIHRVEARVQRAKTSPLRPRPTP